MPVFKSCMDYMLFPLLFWLFHRVIVPLQCWYVGSAVQYRGVCHMAYIFEQYKPKHSAFTRNTLFFLMAE
jgi:hypothetical protein